MVHCWVENGPLSGWEALTLAANPSAMLDQFDWKLFQVWLKLKSSLTETQVKFDWNLKCVWLKVKLSFSQTGGGLGLDWRTVSMGLRFCLSLTTRVSHWESKWLSLRIQSIVIEKRFECQWHLIWKSLTFFCNYGWMRAASQRDAGLCSPFLE